MYVNIIFYDDYKNEIYKFTEKITYSNLIPADYYKLYLEKSNLTCVR